eukprot:3035852-Rhodomonas_salina.1
MLLFSSAIASMSYLDVPCFDLSPYGTHPRASRAFSSLRFNACAQIPDNLDAAVQPLLKHSHSCRGRASIDLVRFLKLLYIVTFPDGQFRPEKGCVRVHILDVTCVACSFHHTRDRIPRRSATIRGS